MDGIASKIMLKKLGIKNVDGFIVRYYAESFLVIF